MSEKRFELEYESIQEINKNGEIIDVLTDDEVVDLLNSLYEENKQLKKEKWNLKLRLKKLAKFQMWGDLEKQFSKIVKENEQLKKSNKKLNEQNMDFLKKIRIATAYMSDKEFKEFRALTSDE